MEEIKKLPTIAIVGRPNVGKSSLFNCVVGRRLAIVHEMAGVTRDRVVAPLARGKRHFQLIDTGGLGMLSGESRRVDQWDLRIAEQVAAAVEGADVLVMVVNVQDGVVPLDEVVAQRLRESGKPVLVVANKSDNPELNNQATEFHKLGFSEIFPISCLHRFGIESLLERALSLLPAAAEGAFDEKAEKPLNIALIGRPNVGKSSLVNALLGEQRVMVSDVAGTTRDAIDIAFSIKDRSGGEHPAQLVDTAGLRKTAKVDDIVEFFSVMRAKSAINRADIVLFLLEAGPDGATAQDKRIASQIEESGKGCVVVVNKCDLYRDEIKTKQMIAEIRHSLPGMSYAPVVCVSAMAKWNLGELLDQISLVMGQLELKIPTGVLNRVLADAFVRKTPPVVGAAPLRMYYASMLSMTPPTVLLFVNDPKYCPDNYLVFLKNTLRGAFDLSGLPVEIKLRARPKKVMSFHSSSSGVPEKKRGGKKWNANSKSKNS